MGKKYPIGFVRTNPDQFLTREEFYAFLQEIQDFVEQNFQPLTEEELEKILV